MSWKYSSASTPRENSSTRDSSQSKYGFLNSKLGSSGLGDRRWTSGLSTSSSSSSPSSNDSKPHRSSSESVEHSPVWATRNTIKDNPASVQRLKERYSVNDSELRRESNKSIKRPDNKEVATTAKPSKFYGRSYTTSYHLDDSKSSSSDTGGTYSKFRRKLDSPTVPDLDRHNYVSRLGSNLRALDTPKSLYIPDSDSSRLCVRKYSTDLSPSSVKDFCKDRNSRSDDHYNHHQDETRVTVVTRGTSPTPTVTSVYLRSKRVDYGIEKVVSRPRKKPEMVNKEIQTDREDNSYSKYALYCDSNIRAKPKSSYSSVGSYGSVYSPTRTTARDFSTLGVGLSDWKRSVSREESDDPTTPDSPGSKLSLGKPPKTLGSPKDQDKKPLIRKSPPSNFRSPLRMDPIKPLESTRSPSSPGQSSPLRMDPVKPTESARSPSSPGHPTSPLQCRLTTTAETLRTCMTQGPQSPKLTIDRCPDLIQAINEASSASESSEEEETSSDDDDEQPVSSAAIAKKSVTNFLQNIPNLPRQSHSRLNLNQKLNAFCPQKINFRRIESGEKAWWMDCPSTDKVPECVARVASSRSVPDGPGSKSPNSSFPAAAPAPAPIPYLGGIHATINGQAWSDTESRSPPPPPPPHEELNGDHSEIVNRDETGSYVLTTHSPLSSLPADNDSHTSMKFNLQVPRDRSLRDVSQKLQNGVLGSPTGDEKTQLDPGGLTGLINRAKSELNGRTVLDVRRSSSREMSPMVTDPKAEIDLYWKELADSVSRPLHLCDLDFTDLNTDDETDILGNRRVNGDAPPPPPPPMLILPVPSLVPGFGGVPAPPPAAQVLAPRINARTPVVPPPPIPQIVKNKKTVKLFWKEVKDDVPVMNMQRENGGRLIWDELTSVTVDTQKLETLFESRAKDLTSKKQQEQNKNKEIIVLDPKRSNAINIGMTKLPPPRAIKTAILKMDSTVVSKEGIEKLLTMLPTEEEKLRIQEAQNLNPDVPLGSAEQFLSTLASISQLEARLRLWAFKLDFEISEKEICEPLMDLKQGMEILRVNKTFRGILSTLLSVGNFLNGYDVKGFQIEYLSKVPEVKDTVHKHSLLHHLCIIVMEKFPDSTDFYSEIGAVTRASKVDFDELAASIKKLEEDCKLSWNYLKMIAKHEGHTAMKVKMSDFLADCAERIIVLGVVHRRVISRFQKFSFWLGVPMNRISTTRPNEIFKIISEFALEFRTTRERVLQQIKKINRDKCRSRGYYNADNSDMVGRKMNSKEAKDDAKLKQLLGTDTSYSENENMPRWRRQRKETKNILQEANQNDAEIIETLIKTANQKSGMRERRRNRAYGKCCKYS